MRSCPECGGSKLSWDFVNNQDWGVLVHITGFYLGCDECSATVLYADMEAVLQLLNDQRWQLDV